MNNDNSSTAVGRNLEHGFKRSKEQKELLWDFFESMKVKLLTHLKVELTLGADDKLELSGPIGTIHSELVYVLQGEHVIQALVLFDNVEAPQGSIRRDLYAVRLNWNGMWADASGEELAYDFDAHTPLAAFQIVQRAIAAQLSLNGERVEQLMAQSLH